MNRNAGKGGDNDRLNLSVIARRGHTLGPWSPENGGRLVIANAVSFVIVFLGWYESSGNAAVRTQVPWMELAIVGLILSAVANAGWLLSGRRSISKARPFVLERPSPHSVNDDLMRGSTGVARNAVLWVPGTRHCHRAGCLLLQGKEHQPVTAEQEEDLVPCEVCLAQ